MPGLAPSKPSIRPRPSGNGRGRAGCWSPTCSITRPITAARLLHAHPGRRPSIGYRPYGDAGVIAMAEPAKSFDEALQILQIEIAQVKADPLAFNISTSSNTATIQGYISSFQSPAEYENARVKLLGKSGVITAGFADLRQSPAEIRPAIGNQRKALVAAIEGPIADTEKRLQEAALQAKLNTESVDVTLPVREAPAEIGR